MTSKRIGVLAGGFNPVTRAHLGLVDAALGVVDEAMCVVPRVYPHKGFHGASLEQRVEMLRRAGNRYQVRISESSGLFIDIAHELHRADPASEIYFICGRDAAERIVNWEYGEQGAVERMFQEFHLLVAGRQGVYDPPEHLKPRIHALPVAAGLDQISSTEVRRRIASGETWDHLVPEPIVDLVKRIYQAS